MGRFGPVDLKHREKVLRKAAELDAQQAQMRAIAAFNTRVATAVNAVLTTFFPDEPTGRNAGTRLNISLALAAAIHVKTGEVDEALIELLDRHVTDQRKIIEMEKRAMEDAIAKEGVHIIDPATGKPVAGVKAAPHPLSDIPLEPAEPLEEGEEFEGIIIDGRPFRFAEGTTPEQKAKAIAWAAEQAKADGLQPEERQAIQALENPEGPTDG